MAPLPLLLLLLSSVLSSSLARPCPLNQDAAALLAFKSAILSDTLHLLSTWNNSTLRNCPSPCTWTGVRCHSHRVIALQLPASQLIGTLSPSLGQLPFLRFLNLSSNNFSGGIPVQLGKSTSLTSLDLSNNQLSGSVPAELGELSELEILNLYENELSGGVPAGLGNCTNLRQLSLPSNKLSGSIPSQLGGLYKLEFLALSGNRLSGGVPPAIGNCSSLTSLQLAENSLSGSIPAELGVLHKLEFLELWENELSGGMPVALGNCTNLIALEAFSNKFSGSIPAELGALYKLEDLNLHQNELSGGVLATLGNCTKLTTLELAQNKLSGRIPAELSLLYELEFLYLWGNELSGGVPAALGNCTNLIELMLSVNFLSGSIPAELGVLYKLELLQLWENDLSGGVPAALGNCTKLILLALNVNNLSGSIPAELGELYQLENLNLWGNGLSGGVPAALGNCTSLINLQLAVNGLSGSIPAELGKLNILSLFALGLNRFTGVLPATLSNCTNLTMFDVSSNQLSGPITDEFCGNWTSLVALGLNDNLFGGRLPPCLSGLEKLSTIYLQANVFVGTIPPFSNLALNYLQASSNNLSGSIPESFGALEGLVSLDLSYNHLSGQIPNNLGSLQRLTTLNLSKNALSGNIPYTLGSCVELIIVDLSHNTLTGNVPSTFVSLESLTKLDLSDNQLVGRIPTTWPYNDTRLVNLSGNPLLCGTIVNRPCNSSNPESLQKASSDLKRIVSIVVAVIVVVLLILGLVIWRHHNLVQSDTNIGYNGRPSHGLRSKAIKVSADELREATDGFSEANILGESGSSTVYKGTLANDMRVAIKVLKFELLMGMNKEVEVARLKREVDLLAMVRHRNIVRVLGCCFNLEIQAIILELVPNGNLDHYLHGMERHDAITKKEKLRLLRGIAQGLEYLHHWHDPTKTIVHCDVKPANILLDEEWEPLIADFGIAKLLQQGMDEMNQPTSLSMLLRGSIGYIAPEYAFGAQVSCAGDVYSFGVVMLEILMCRRPMEVSSGMAGEQETLMSLVQAAFPDQLLGLFGSLDMTSEQSVALAQLGLSCTSPVPNNRPTMLQVTRALNTIANLSNDPHPYPTLQQLLG